jgi:SAM-dependent methyltransferase
MTAMKSVIRGALARALQLLDDKRMARLWIDMARRRSLMLPPDAGMRFLLDLDGGLYEIEGYAAVRYGDGEHPKHRLTCYHDFFVTRVRLGERVLDIGCGIGAVARDVAERSQAWVVGIDLSAEEIATARNHYAHPRVEYCVGNALTDLPDERFDVVILSNVLEHLPSRPAFLQRMVEVVRPSRVLVRVPIYERDWRVPLKKELGVDYRLDVTHETEYTLDGFAEEMALAHLVVFHQEIRWGEVWAEVRPRD